MKKIKAFFSRKLLVFILVPIIMAVNVQMGSPLDEESVKQLVYAAIAYILGQAAIDTISKEEH